jgi:cyanophycin synthetase
MPGLDAHRCSIGERGGFVIRLRHGTYAPHIVEHVALELQAMIGHHVGYGRTRGGDAAGEYTVVVEHLHDAVGLRAAATALEVVQRAIAGTLDSVTHAVSELQALAGMPSAPAIRQRVLCGITGGTQRAETRAEIVRRGAGDGALIVDVAPGYILHAGLPYAESSIAIVTDADPVDVPDRYRAPDRAQRLLSVIADPIDRGGILIAPAAEWEIQDRARDAGCRVAVFATDDRITAADTKVACATALVVGGRIVIERHDARIDAGPLIGAVAPTAQVAAALAAYLLRQVAPAGSDGTRC